MSLPLFFVFLLSTCYNVFCRRFVTTCFIVNLLRWVVVSSMVSFFMGFHVGSLVGKIRSNKVIKSNSVCDHAIDLESKVL